MQVPAVKLFLEVAEAGSLSKVAARRQTVQSHISRQITDFEQACGGALFRRTGRGVVLTDLGHRAATRLRVWLQETERIAEELRLEAGQLSGEVRLGIIPSAAHPLMTALFTRMQGTHPGIRLNIVEAQGIELDAMLDNGAVDLAILFRYRRPRGSDEKLLCEAGTYLISAPDNPATAEPTIPFKRLANLPLVLPRHPSHWRQALDDAASSLGFKLNALVEADSLTVQKELVASHPEVAAVMGPFSVARDLQSGRLRASKLLSPELVRHVTLAEPRHGKHSPACRVVADQIQDIIGSWGGRLTP